MGKRDIVSYNTQKAKRADVVKAIHDLNNQIASEYAYRKPYDNARRAVAPLSSFSTPEEREEWHRRRYTLPVSIQTQIGWLRKQGVEVDEEEVRRRYFHLPEERGNRRSYNQKRIAKKKRELKRRKLEDVHES